ncbi:MAG: hypothetical protein KAX05_01820 [Bacteroidales bacterium]|nr:hypothetical protein [Bacteroidales bacterium]
MKTPSTLIVFSIFFILNQSELFSQQTENWLDRSDPIQYRKLYLHTDRDYYFLGDSVWFKAYYLDGQTHQFICGFYSMYADLVDKSGQTIRSQVFPIDNGETAGNMIIPDSIEPGEYLLRAFTDFQRSFGEDAFFHKVLNISKVKSSSDLAEELSTMKQPEIDVAFLPEGGFLLAGQMNTVGLKAIDETGRGISLQGEILDSKGEVVTLFDMKYKGMDKIHFSPREGETYKVNLPGFPDYKYEFIDIVEEGIKIEFTGELGDDLLFLVITNSESLEGENYYFAIMHQGGVIYYKEFAQKEKVFPIKVNRSALPAGINRFVLLNEQLKPISERLHFSKNFEVNDIKVKLDQNAYNTRSHVKLEIFDEEEIGGGAFSSLSVAVVDENAVGENGPDLNILSWLLIDSELKGNIESPSDYFEDDENISSENKLNLLMLTQGWSRYLWNTIPEQSITHESEEVEGISINGNVRKAFSKKPVVNGDVDLKIYNNDHFISAEGKTDENGRFSFDNIFFTDTAAVFIQACNKKGKLSTEVFLDTVFKKSPGVSKLYLPTSKIWTDVPVELYQQKYFNDLAMRDYILESGSILLEEVKVIGQKTEKDDGHFRIYSKPRTSFKVTDRDLGYQNVFDYLQPRVSGVGGGTAISFIGDSGVIYLLDGFPVPGEILMSIPMSDIDVVDVLKHYSIGEIAIFGTRGAGGVISVFTKKGGDISYDSYTPGTISERIAGYSSYREFYSPTYTPENVGSEKPDHRITLYWNPNIITEDGKATVSFFTSDDISRYKIFVEGITQIGEICLGISEFVVNKNHVDLGK